jgi:hypothetical protein
MRLFGGKDFYDCGLSLGIDPSIILVRGKSKSIPVKDAGGSLLTRSLEVKPISTIVYSVSVAFCDMIYRGAMVSGNLGRDEGIWSADKLRAWVAAKKGTTVKVGGRWTDGKMTLEEYFTPFPASEVLRDYMIRNKVSILVETMDRYYRDDPYFEVNPFTLGKIGFAKALDPYSAFQELSMWIGGVLGGTSPEIVRITDDQVLIANHGFDKHSFRSSVRTA